jgi:hypothetical protein
MNKGENEEGTIRTKKIGVDKAGGMIANPDKSETNLLCHFGCRLTKLTNLHVSRQLEWGSDPTIRLSVAKQYDALSTAHVAQLGVRSGKTARPLGIQKERRPMTNTSPHNDAG